MKAATICLLAVLAVATSLELELSAQSSLTFDSEQSKKHPVAKVIKLLKDMVKTQEREGEEDQKAYDELTCWLITNDKEKTQAVADAKSLISELETSIEDKTAQSARLYMEIRNLKRDVSKDQYALEQATEMRLQQLAEFNVEEKDLLQSTYSVKNAVTVLSKHTPTPGEFLQTSPDHLQSVATTVQDAMLKHNKLLASVITPTQRQEMAAFIQAPKYNSQSGEIFGILKQMQETFETNLANAQKDEKRNLDTFEELKIAKENEIKAGEDQADAKSEQQSGIDDQLAQDKQNVIDTKKSLEADEKELASLKEHRELSDSEWEIRQKTRAEEMEATSQALAVLSSDDAHDLTSRTFNPSFLQTEMHADRRAQVAKLFAEKLQNPRFSAMAMQVRIAAFTKVVKAIEEMIVQLGKEKAVEIKQKDYCVQEFTRNEKENIVKAREKDDAEALVAKLTAAIAKLEEAIATLESEIAEMQKELKVAGENRVKENKEFQVVVADQKATQKLLNSALNILKGFYAKKAAAAASLMQTEEGKPEGTKTYKENASAGGVMGMLKQIVVDAKAMETAATADEAQALKEYEAFKAASEAAMKAKQDEISNKQADLAEAHTAKNAADEDLANAELELDQLANTAKELHESCDWNLKNFDARQKARDEEVAALEQAKGILKGAK